MPKDLQEQLPKDMPKELQEQSPEDMPEELEEQFTKDAPKELQAQFPKVAPKELQEHRHLHEAPSTGAVGGCCGRRAGRCQLQHWCPGAAMLLGPA